MKLRIGWLLLLLTMTTACVSHRQESGPAPIKRNQGIARIKPKPPLSETPAPAALKEKLLNHYRDWYAAPYRLGGLSKRGIDCSGFVYLTYRQQLNKQIPRTTLAQSNQGRFVARQALQIGDLVFFKTAVKVRHVGIYIGERQFIHASTSSGVMLSRLDNPYWQRHYWKAIRF